MTREQAILRYPGLRAGVRVIGQDGVNLGWIKSLRESVFDIEWGALVQHDVSIPFDDILEVRPLVGHGSETLECIVKKSKDALGTPDNLRGPADRVGAASPDADLTS